MVDIKNILSKAKLSRTDLSHVYKNIKQLKLNISWLELLRKNSREDALNKLRNKLEPKKTKFIVSGTYIKKVTLIFRRTDNKSFFGGPERKVIETEEKYNETVTAIDKKDALKKARADLKDQEIVTDEYNGNTAIKKYKVKSLRAIPHSKFKDVPEMQAKMRNIIRSDYCFF